MTTKDFFKQLQSNGLFESQAIVIMDKVIEATKSDFEAHNKNEHVITFFEGYTFTWNSPAQNYPKVLLNIVYDSYIKPVGLTWIDENKPQACASY